MCGICGTFSYQKVNQEDILLINRMNEIQRHRGPNDEGMYSSDFCVLGHRRLSIIDLTSDGHQPFYSDDKRYILIYNGEIFNYIELREELKEKGWKFRTQTDTEVLLKAYQEYGEKCLAKFNGMFAFVIYDTKDNSLFFARDRFGIKPLYYIFLGSKIYFASEIKAFKAITEIKLSVNSQSVFDYLVFNRTDIFSDTFFKEIKRIPKGHYGIYNHDGLTIKQWWNPENYLGQCQDSILVIKEKINQIMNSAVTLRMRSDVNVGSCLSGGIDSSTILGILAKNGFIHNGYATFSASFPGERFDESGYADLLTEKFKCSNYKVYPSSDNCFNELRRFVYVHDEPTINAAYFAQYEVMRLAKEHNVTVLLDGQGADEIFAGYHYLHGFLLLEMIKNKNYAKFTSSLFSTMFRQQQMNAYQTLLFQLVPKKTKTILLRNKASYLTREYFSEHIKESIIFNKFFDANDLNTSLVRHFQYKLEHLLRSEDRNSMAFSIEARVPYLDYRLVEYLFSVSGNLKINRGVTKYIQKQALGQYTIKEILERKDKVGFDTPQNKWFKEKQWQDLANEAARELLEEFPGIFNKNIIKRMNSFDAWKIIQLFVWKDTLK